MFGFFHGAWLFHLVWGLVSFAFVGLDVADSMNSMGLTYTELYGLSVNATCAFATHVAFKALPLPESFFLGGPWGRVRLCCICWLTLRPSSFPSVFLLGGWWGNV